MIRYIYVLLTYLFTVLSDDNTTQNIYHLNFNRV